MAIAPSAAIMYPSFFMMSSSFEREINIASRGTFPAKPKRILNGHSSMSAKARRDGKAYLKPVQTVINGVPFGRPYQAPFAVR